MTGDDGEDVAMQPRCIHCLGENYVLNVIAYSFGEAGCHRCGKHSRQMTYEQYRDALTEAKQRQLRDQIPRPRRPWLE